MWDGIHCSLDILRTTSPRDKVKGVLLLTDGIPNVEPPRGHEYMLEKYFRDNDFYCMVSCYGFGYNLLSDLLLNISNISGGDGFSFIPDASLLGNVFIHGISNLLTTALTNVDVEINLKNNVTFVPGEGRCGNVKRLSFMIDSLKYGESKNYIFNVITGDQEELGDFVNVTLSTPTLKLETSEYTKPENDYYLEQKYRHEAIHMIKQCIDLKKFNDNSFEGLLNELITEIRGVSESNEYLSNILFDLNGQVKEALNMTSQGEREDWFSRWGIHYLRSLQDAYKHELCNNFKDKGVSNFGGDLFEYIRNQVSDVFDSIPPPKADIVQTRGRYKGGQTVTRSAPVSMSVYNNASGGCCAEGSMVLMADDNYKKVEELKKGDEVYTYDSENKKRFSKSKIECVVETTCYAGKELMSTIGNLRITPYHPIIHYMAFQEHWKFPINISKPTVIDCGSMYTFVVENRKALIVDGFVFATYGHGLEGEVISHDYFGTDNVINDLRKKNTYDEGYVVLTKDKFRKEKGVVVRIE
jgi:hypothetical protein